MQNRTRALTQLVTQFPTVQVFRRSAATLVFLLLTVGTQAMGQSSPSSQATNFPSKPVRMIVPFPPGGGTDTLARPIAQKLSELWGQRVLVENRAGAGGTLASEFTAKSAPDGYTIMLACWR